MNPQIAGSTEFNMLLEGIIVKDDAKIFDSCLRYDFCLQKWGTELLSLGNSDCLSPEMMNLVLSGLSLSLTLLIQSCTEFETLSDYLDAQVKILGHKRHVDLGVIFIQVLSNPQNRYYMTWVKMYTSLGAWSFIFWFRLPQKSNNWHLFCFCLERPFGHLEQPVAKSWRCATGGYLDFQNGCLWKAEKTLF